MNRSNPGLLWLILVSGAVLSGCTSSDQLELQAWIQAERNTIQPTIAPLAEPTRFTPQVYQGERQLEPFSREKMASGLQGTRVLPAADAALMAPDIHRRKQALEAYPLEHMAMVGSLSREGQRVALVRVDQWLYQVRAGSYLGQNHGRVSRITDNEIFLREIVQDTAGDWTVRSATLQLKGDVSK